MYDNYAIAEKQAAGQLIGGRRPDITIGENIDARIADAQARLDELIATKERMAESGLLNVRIDDLNRSISY
jgi:N-formylglutamate amidohydrolase